MSQVPACARSPFKDFRATSSLRSDEEGSAYGAGARAPATDAMSALASAASVGCGARSNLPSDERNVLIASPSKVTCNLRTALAAPMKLQP
eukprot:6190903-Pleurochrysis_carterae.AAC.3